MKLFLHLNTFILVPLLVHHILSCKYSETTPKERGQAKKVMGALFILFYWCDKCSYFIWFLEIYYTVSEKLFLLEAFAKRPYTTYSKSNWLLEQSTLPKVVARQAIKTLAKVRFTRIVFAFFAMFCIKRCVFFNVISFV